jgi:catechol 2,3-dioxygenase-like lactoylglutathione lyase family enzyme
MESDMPKITTSCRTSTPLLTTTMLSHGTLTSIDLQASRRFYEEVLGLEVVQLNPAVLLTRKGSNHTYVVVETGEDSTMSMLGHNGIDVATREEVDQAHEILHRVKDEYGIRRINRVTEQNGQYSFYFVDLDGNWWEVLQARPDGYSYLLDEQRDITGRTDLDPDDIDLHVSNDAVAARIGAIGARAGQ